MSLLDNLLAAKVYDLAQSYFVGMPHFPTHPPFLFGLTKNMASTGCRTAAAQRRMP
jgi:kynurenine formamidase